MKKYTRLRYRHIYGTGRQFVKLQGRSQWYPVNEEQAAPLPQEPFVFSNEALYMLEKNRIRLAVHMKLDTGNPETRLQQALREAALQEIARDLKAGLDEEKLAEAIDFFSRRDELFNK